jgi:hypothetical protein
METYVDNLPFPDESALCIANKCKLHVTGVAAYALIPLSRRAVLQVWGYAELYPMNQVRQLL